VLLVDFFRLYGRALNNQEVGAVSLMCCAHQGMSWLCLQPLAGGMGW